MSIEILAYARMTMPLSVILGRASARTEELVRRRASFWGNKSAALIEHDHAFFARDSRLRKNDAFVSIVGANDNVRENLNKKINESPLDLVQIVKGSTASKASTPEQNLSYAKTRYLDEVTHRALRGMTFIANDNYSTINITTTTTIFKQAI